jgi:hypothetical protein
MHDIDSQKNLTRFFDFIRRWTNFERHGLLRSSQTAGLRDKARGGFEVAENLLSRPTWLEATSEG